MRQNQKANRIEWIDVLKFICIFFVMCNHMDEAGDVPLSTGYYPFFLLGFFFASGYVYKSVDFKTFIKKKLLGILLPWGIFAVAVPLVRGIISKEGVLTTLVCNLIQIRGNGDSLWFLAALFVSFIPFYFIEKYLSRKKALILSAVLATASVFYVKFAPNIHYNFLGIDYQANYLPWHLHCVPLTTFFMLLGRYYRGNVEEKLQRFIKPWIFVAVLFLYAAAVVPYYICTGGSFGINLYGGNNVYFFFLWMAAVGLGLIALIMVSKFIKPNKFILFVGSNTLLYYVLHIETENFMLHLPAIFFYGRVFGAHYSLMHIISDLIFDKIPFLVANAAAYRACSVVLYLIVYPATVLISMAVIAVPVYIVNNFLPFIVGRRYPFKTKVYLYRAQQFFITRFLHLNAKKLGGECAACRADEKLAVLAREGKIKKALIITSAGFLNRGDAVAELAAALRDGGATVEVTAISSAEPYAAELEQMAERLAHFGADGVIALGGGSVIDGAKLVCALAEGKGKRAADMRGAFKAGRRARLLVAIPTTAGSGSEVTPVTVINDVENGRGVKYPAFDYSLAPDVAVLDERYSLTLPPQTTASTGMDALTHAVEAYTNKFGDGAAKELAAGAVKTIFKYLPKAYADGKDEGARAEMLKAAYNAGAAFSVNLVGCVHAVAHAVGARYRLPHGLVNAVALPVVLKAYGKSAQKALAALARETGLEGEDDEALAEAFIKAIEELDRSLGIPENIAELQMDDIPALAKTIIKEARVYPVPRVLSKDDIEGILYQLTPSNGLNATAQNMSQAEAIPPAASAIL